MLPAIVDRGLSPTIAEVRSTHGSVATSTSGWSIWTRCRVHRWYPACPSLGFDARDHLGGTGPDASADIKTNVETLSSPAGGIEPQSLSGGSSCSPIRGCSVHVFDPLTVFWCFDAAATLRCVVAEVHNTYGERHAYLLTLGRQRPCGRRQAVLRFAVQRRVRALRDAVHAHRALGQGLGLTRSIRSARVRGCVRGSTRAGDRQDDRPVRAAHAGDAAEGVGPDPRPWDRTLASRMPIIDRPRHTPQEGVRSTSTTTPRPVHRTESRTRSAGELARTVHPSEGADEGRHRPATRAARSCRTAARIDLPDGTSIGTGGAADPVW